MTVYNRESRYDKIMKLKVKPVIGLGNTATKQSLARKKIMDTSFGSMASSRSSANKENIAHNR